MELIRLNCCGILEVDQMGGGFTADEVLPAILNLSNWEDEQLLNHCAWVIFSQAEAGTYGSAFRDWLEARNLGTVIALPRTLNTNSGNHIEVFMWQVDHSALSKWMDANWKAPEREAVGGCNCTRCRARALFGT